MTEMQQGVSIKIFLDGASLDDLRKLSSLSFVKGFTTNPSLMRKAGVTDYESFIKEALPIIGDKPISFEVIADDFAEMKRQAIKLRSYAENIYVKIPITNTKKEWSLDLIKYLAHNGVKVNVTAVFTLGQVKRLLPVLEGGEMAIVSIFAGRIADTGIDPVPILKEAKRVLRRLKNVELLWASSREVLNIFQAQEAGCDIITLTPDIVKKFDVIGHDHDAFSLDTVKMFYNDASSSGLNL